VNRRHALAVVLLAACSRGRADIETPFLRALVDAGREFGETPPAESTWAIRELDRIAASVRSRRRAGEPWRGALLSELFERQSFVREVEAPELTFVLLPAVLRGRRGSCVGLGLLVLALGELLELDVAGVVLPGHFFVRIREGGHEHNVELLRRGEEMSDEWYRQRFPIPGGRAPAYARRITHDEVLGVVAYNVGNQRRRQGRLEEARHAYQAAVRRFPDLAEAHASLGAVLHLLGALDEAEAAYERARGLYPSLPGVAQNLELLQSERRNR
jgi:regulator of sirC expression with transglutaminase-like and TPR domain